MAQEPIAFVNKVLLGHRHAPLMTNDLWLLLYYKGRDEWLLQNLYGKQSQKCLLTCPS